MRARLGVGLFVIAPGLVLGWLLWEHDRPQAEEVRLEPALVFEEGGPAGFELASVRAAQVAGERLVLENTASSGPNGSPAGELLAEEPGGHRAGLWVKVVDEQLTPMGDVRVVLRSASKPDGKPESVGSSGADGRVWLGAPFDADSSERRVEPAGPAPRVDGVTFDPAQLGDEPLLLVLSAGAGLDVHVIDEGGTSAEGALVRLVAPKDYDGVFGNLRHIDTALVAEGHVRAGVCSFQRLPPDTDLLLHVQAPLPLGPLTLRTRTPGVGESSKVEARYSADDIVLLGELRGDVAKVRWSWSLFDPEPPRSVSWGYRNLLEVAEDGRFLIRLPSDAPSRLGPAVCLAVHRDSDLLEAVELPPLRGAKVIPLAPMDAATSILSAGIVYSDSHGDAEEAQLVVRGSLPPGGSEILHAAGWVEKDAHGEFSFVGRVPAHWTWELSSVSKEWKVAEPAVFRPGATDHRVLLLRVDGPQKGRLVPGPLLAASELWRDHLSVQLHASDGARVRGAYLEFDGRFDLVVPLAELVKITVRAKWHERPLLEWHVVPGAALEVSLPPELRLVRLDVRGEGGAPIAAKATDPKLDRAFRNPPRAESPLVVLLDLGAHDVLVEADGYRDTLVPAVSEDRRVDLAQRGVPLILRAADLPELSHEFRLRPLLSRGLRARSDRAGLLEFDSQGTVSVTAGGLGEYHVHLQMERVTASSRTIRVLDGEGSPRIQVVEPNEGEGPAEFTLAFDRARILEALANLR